MLELIKIPDAAWKSTAFNIQGTGWGTTIGASEG
jgi:hypothetical protein